jgi:CHAT domain-containing protein
MLSEALALGDIDVAGLPDDQRDAIVELRAGVRTLEAEMRLPPDTPGRRADTELTPLLRQARANLHELIQAIRQQQCDFMPVGLDVSNILALIPNAGALVAPLITSQGAAVFVLPHTVETVADEHVLYLDRLDHDGFRALILGDNAEPGWLLGYEALVNNGPLEDWLSHIGAQTRRMWDSLMGPIHQRLSSLGVATGASVTILPQAGLGLLPLHSAWREVDGAQRTFLDDYTVSYGPSAYALSVSRRRLREQRRQRLALLSVINPTGDLPFASIEGQAIASALGSVPTLCLEGPAAVQADVIAAAEGRSYLHFACHGFYNWQDAMGSALVLTGGEPLTLAEIIGPGFDLSAARLVTLSACETGLAEFIQSPDEYIGLPTGFLQAGAPAVLSSLWAVNDLSTSLLMQELYRRHLSDGQEIPAALRDAQLWLRDATAKELELAAYWERHYRASGRRDVDAYHAMRYFQHHPDEQPFAHPYYWAAFAFTGM